jgi:hypothetical protein
MTIYLSNIKGSLEEMDELFDKAKQLSVRLYEYDDKPNNRSFNITIRCNDEIVPKIKRIKTLKSLIKLDKTFGQIK